MKSIQLLGMKHSGKSTLGRLLAQKTSRIFYDLDTLLEAQHPGGKLNSREIYRQFGKDYFQEKEALAAVQAGGLLSSGQGVLAWGGGTITNPRAVEALRGAGLRVFLDEDCAVLFERIMRGGLPAFLSPDHPWEDFQKLYGERTEKMRAECDLVLDLRGCGIDAALTKILSIDTGE